jgi:hypothetical protein
VFERVKTAHALDSAATVIGAFRSMPVLNKDETSKQLGYYKKEGLRDFSQAT